MKKLLNVLVLLVAALMFANCTNSNSPDSKKSTSNSLVGKWANVVAYSGAELDLVHSYIDFGTSGDLSVYSPSITCAMDNERNIIMKEGTEWKVSFTAKYNYDEKSQSIWISDIKVGTIEKIDDDEFVLPASMFEAIKNGTYRRIKDFTFGSTYSSTSEDYINGKELKIDYDKSTVNGFKFDNTVRKCWAWTMTTVTNDAQIMITYYLWGTMFELMVTCESAMYEASRSGIIASYTFVEAAKFKQSDDTCENSNNNY